jgi:two-component system CheB/CheR fusion protein
LPDAETPPEFEDLLEYVKQSRGFDFTGYKRASLRRRIDKRMRSLNIEEYDAYVDYLEVHPQEFVILFNAILINVTSFFRDAPTWSFLGDEVLPQHLATIPADKPIRVWSAGCASGQEAYSLAVLFAELLGVEEFKRRVKIYGTDIDDEALQLARAATYTETEMSGLPIDLRDRYFENVSDRYSFRPDLRRSVIFGRLDILHDAPISRLELLACRNTLMYFNAETQAQVIDRFHFALNDSGVLLLGKAETLLSHSVLFDAIDRKRRVFKKVALPRGRPPAGERFPIGGETETLQQPTELHAAALESVPFPALLIDQTGRLVDVNEPARQLFGLAPRDYGQLLQDLEISYRPVELRSPIAQAYAERRSVRISGVRVISGDMARSLDVDVVPLYRGTESIGVGVFFHDLTLQRELEDQLRQSTQELEQAYQELQSANEELETTNEELQSTIEELETTNEELQSTNEELETMNEELQSTNDELHTVNEELRIRSDELDNLNHFLQAVLTSFRGGVVVVDTERRVRVWNPRAEDLWGVREDEVRDVDLAEVDIGLPVAELVPTLDDVLRGRRHGADGQDDLVLDAVTRRGRPARTRVSFTPLHADGTITGAILVMEVLDG